MYEYTIGEDKYIQKELVWGQWLQVIDEIEGVTLPEDLQPLELIKSLKDKLPKVLSIVLIKEGESLLDRVLTDRPRQLSFYMTPQQIMDVVSDFFDVNPLHLLLKNLINRVNQIKGKVEEGINSSGMMQTEQLSSLPEETS